MEHHKDCSPSEQHADSMQEQTPRLRSGRIYITVTGNASAEDRQLLYTTDPSGFGFISKEIVIEEIWNGSSIHAVCTGLCRPAMLVVDADSFAGWGNSQLILLHLMNERRRKDKDTFLLFEEEPEASFSGFIAQIADLLRRAARIPLQELLERKYNLFPEMQIQKFTDCLIRDVVIDHGTVYLVCGCFADADQTETVIAAVRNDTGRYVAVSSQEARRVLQIYAMKQMEAKKLKALSERPDIEREQRMLLLDLKADEARRKVGRDPAGTTDESLLFADFHIYTVRSDGLKKPSEILERAIGRGLTQIAFLDHNTVMPKEPLRNLAEAYRGRIRLICGSEISAFYADGRKRTEVHIGALGIDSDAEICFRGDTMTMEQFLQVNRPDEEAYITEMSDKLRIETDAYAHYAAMDEVVKIIIEAKGVPMLCHPLKYGFSEEVLQKFVRAFAEAAAGHPAAIEAGYRKYSREQQRALKDLAKAEGLFLSTGSDFHGRFETDDILSPEEIISGGCAGTDHVGNLLRDVLGEPLHGSGRSGCI